MKDEAVELHVCPVDWLRLEVVMLHPFDIRSWAVDFGIFDHPDILYYELKIWEGF
jgi:hypothetical protein